MKRRSAVSPKAHNPRLEKAKSLKGLKIVLGVYDWSHVKVNDLGYVTAAETGCLLFKNPNGILTPSSSYLAEKDEILDGDVLAGFKLAAWNWFGKK